MAEKIKKFFAKKKTDAKFKFAGPGHKLTEDTTSKASKSSSASSSKENVVTKPRNLTQESKLAAEAALLRIQGQRRENPSFNTSLSAIRAQVKRELENEKKSSETEVNKPLTAAAVPEVHLEASPHLAANGVYFKCPIIGNEICSKEEWKKNIKTFLYEQLSEEPGLTACLIIQSCNTNKEKIDACVDTLCKYLENIVAHPDEEKYHKIRMSNRVFSEKVQPLEGAMEVLNAAGFREQVITNDAGTEESFLVFHIENVESIESLTILLDALKTAEPIQLELDRNLQVLLPSQAAQRMDLPQAFYSISPEEIKREHQLKAELADKNTMLRTKAMREKDELREIRKYKYALIRIHFPDGIFLQGTFSIYDKVSEIFKFVKENLEHEGLPFVLNSATGFRLSSEEESDKNLIDFRLVPATILNFSWDQSVAEDIAKSEQKDVYLKPEVMVLVQQM